MWWYWEPRKGYSSMREALPNASSGLQAPPAFLERPKEEYFQEVGRELLIPCSAQGDPPPIVSWAKVRLLSLLCLYSGQYTPSSLCPCSFCGKEDVGRERFSEAGWGGSWSCPERQVAPLVRGGCVCPQG